MVQGGIFDTTSIPEAIGKFDRARCDGVDPDPVRRQRQGLRRCVVRQRGLGRRIRCAAGTRLLRGDRGQVEDAGVGRGAQPRQRKARGADRRHQVDLQAGGPAVFVIGHAVAGGVVDQHIDAAERIGSGLQPGADAAEVAQIGGEGVQLRALGLRIGLQGVKPRLPAGAGRHLRTGAGEGQRQFAADALAATGDQHPAAGEIDHRPAVARGGALRHHRSNLMPWASGSESE
ncbi:hypothetical protein D3C71_1569230 [compost metagenome]